MILEISNYCKYKDSHLRYILQYLTMNSKVELDCYNCVQYTMLNKNIQYADKTFHHCVVHYFV